VGYSAEKMAETIEEQVLYPDILSWAPPVIKIMDMVHEEEL
jgi:hypothetical protein